MKTTEFHGSRAFGPDPFAQACGCPVATCGFVILSDPVTDSCPQHGMTATFRGAHTEYNCPTRGKNDGNK